MNDVGLIGMLLFQLPLWMVGIILIAFCLGARELGGFACRRWRRNHHDGEPVSDSAENNIIGAIFGLLAFVLGFTFSIAIDRYDTRRGLVAEEANAISTTYLRADLFDEPYRSRLHSVLRAYAHSRIAPAGVWDAKMEAQLQRTLALKQQLWDESRAALMPVRQTEQASYFVETVNHTLDTGTIRELYSRLHVPTIILAVMLLYMIVASGMLGYLLQAWGGGRRWSSTLMIVLFAVVIMLILDVDRPQGGTIRVPQRALEELVAQLDRDAVRVPMVSPVRADGR